MPPGESAGLTLKQARRSGPSLRDAVRCRHYRIEVDGILRAIGAGLKHAGDATPNVAFAQVHERCVIPAFRRVHVRHIDFCKRAFIEHRAGISMIVVRDIRHHHAQLRIDAEVEIPVLPAHLIPGEPEAAERLLN